MSCCWPWNHRVPYRTVVPNLFGTRDQFHGRQFLHGRGGSGGDASNGSGSNVSDGEQQMKLCSPAHHSLTSCCAAWFLIGFLTLTQPNRVPQGLGTPAIEDCSTDEIIHFPGELNHDLVSQRATFF